MVVKVCVEYMYCMCPHGFVYYVLLEPVLCIPSSAITASAWARMPIDELRTTTMSIVFRLWATHAAGEDAVGVVP